MESRETISASDLNERIAEVTNKVAYGGQSFVVLKHGKPVCEIVPLRFDKIKEGKRNER